MAERQPSIARRIHFTVLISVVIFALFATALAMGVAQHAEDNLLANILQARLSGRLDEAMFQTVPADAVPEPIARGLGSGTGPTELHLADGAEVMAYRPQANGPVFLFDVNSMEMEAMASLEYGLVPVVLVFVGFVLILGPASLITTRLLRPLRRLVATIATARPGESVEIADDLRKRRDEVGLLSEALVGMCDRVDGFVERERRFSRDASHELRTPVTVASGALDLLRRNQSLDPAARRAVDRIERANRDMADLIEAFLLLARERGLDDLNEDLAIDALLDDAIANHAQQIERRGLQFERVGPGSLSAAAPATIARIVFRNLIRNAITHAKGTVVTITTEHSPVRVTIANEADAPSEGQSARRGFGLTIAADCCRRLGWQLDLNRSVDRFVVTITFL